MKLELLRVIRIGTILLYTYVLWVIIELTANFINFFSEYQVNILVLKTSDYRNIYFNISFIISLIIFVIALIKIKILNYSILFLIPLMNMILFIVYYLVLTHTIGTACGFAESMGLNSGVYYSIKWRWFITGIIYDKNVQSGVDFDLFIKFILLILTYFSSLLVIKMITVYIGKHSSKKFAIPQYEVKK